MLLSLVFICIVALILIWLKYKVTKVTKLNTATPHKIKCINELKNLISPQKIMDNKYLIRNLDGLSISYDINNLQHKLFYTKTPVTYVIENTSNYYYIYTDTSPRLYLNININGDIRFKLQKNIKGNKWLFLKLDTDDLLKNLLVNEIKSKTGDSNSLYDKYNFIYKNGHFIQSLDYSYYITNTQSSPCPNLKDILIISIK